MPNRWTERPTPAARVLARALEEHPDWTQQSLAHVVGLNANVISRWLHAKSDPPQDRVAEVARRLGYDPAEIGITDPRALVRRTAAIAPLADDEHPPAWFTNQQLQTDAYLRSLEQRAIRAEQLLERIVRAVEVSR